MALPQRQLVVKSTQVPHPVLVAMTARIKSLGRMDVMGKRRPQDGRIKTRMPDGEEIELRLSTLPTAHGEKVVMRIFDPEVLTRDFTDLGFTKDETETWTHLTRQTGGILLVTGPTGSGKTTTLYTTLKPVSYTHLRAHETVLDLVCRLLLENRNNTQPPQ